MLPHDQCINRPFLIVLLPGTAAFSHWSVRTHSSIHTVRCSKSIAMLEIDLCRFELDMMNMHGVEGVTRNRSFLQMYGVTKG